MKKLIQESIDLIRKKALFNQENNTIYFVGLCEYLKSLELLAKQNLAAKAINNEELNPGFLKFGFFGCYKLQKMLSLLKRFVVAGR